MSAGAVARAFVVELGEAIEEAPEIGSVVILYERGRGWSVSVDGRSGCLAAKAAQAVDAAIRLLDDRVIMMRSP